MGNLNYHVKNLCCVSLSSRTSIEMSTVVWDCDKIVGGICRFCDKSWPRQTLMIQLWERCDVQNGHHFIFKDMKSHVIIGGVSLATVLGFFSSQQWAICNSAITKGIFFNVVILWVKFFHISKTPTSHAAVSQLYEVFIFCKTSCYFLKVNML